MILFVAVTGSSVVVHFVASVNFVFATNFQYHGFLTEVFISAGGMVILVFFVVATIFKTVVACIAVIF